MSKAIDLQKKFHGEPRTGSLGNWCHTFWNFILFSRTEKIQRAEHFKWLPKKKYSFPQILHHGKTYIERSKVIVRDDIKTRHVGSKALVAIRVCGARHGCQGTPPEVTLCKQDPRLVLGDPLHAITPLTSQFACCLSSFNTFSEEKK